MNSTNTLRDLVTIVHEGGHAVQSILDKPLELVDYKSLPSEVAELASMSMELMSMEHWHHFFADKNELNRARLKHLEDVLKGLPWIAAVDAFQHWIYLHPNHTVEERSQAWLDVYQRFNGNVINWDGLNEIKETLWHRQLHIFEVPFYYIEYGFAQLGAIAVWRNFRKNPNDALAKYIKALSLGYTDSIPNIYKTAGVSFEFSADYVRELCTFVKSEMAKLS
jgi:oligoendopeptidase F